MFNNGTWLDREKWVFLTIVRNQLMKIINLITIRSGKCIEKIHRVFFCIFTEFVFAN